MNVLRSPWFSGALAAVAVGVVAFQVLNSGRSRGRPARVVSPPAATTTATPAPTQPKAAPPVAAPDAPPPPEKVATGLMPVDRRFVQSRLAEWMEAPRRDPFLNAAYKFEVVPDQLSPVSGWKLNAVWRQTGSRVATINGAIYQEGEQIEGYKIERIERDQVWFSGPTGREPLGFANGPIETNAVPKSATPAPRSARTSKLYPSIPFLED